jgi:hypothetical protein
MNGPLTISPELRKEDCRFVGVNVLQLVCRWSKPNIELTPPGCVLVRPCSSLWVNTLRHRSTVGQQGVFTPRGQRPILNFTPGGKH